MGVSVKFHLKWGHIFHNTPDIEGPLPPGPTLHVLGGMGLHTDFDIGEFQRISIDSVEAAIRDARTRPGGVPVMDVVCLTTHAQGPNKPEKYKLLQGNPVVREYNAKVTQLCREHNFPVLEFFNVTRNTHTWDGQHFGMTGNVLKVQILLNWLSTLNAGFPCYKPFEFAQG